ncbi:MAG: hypothetical protein GXX09_12610 [Syntrophomonadaceae bacterium]|nr:hypothetical protein [Syntrophomonadaceae bacterium]
MYEERIGQWKLELSEASKRALLGDLGLPGDSLIIHDIYLSDVALGVYMSWNAVDDKRNNEMVKDSIGRVLRLLGAYAEKFGFILPVIGFLRTEVETNVEYIQRWAGDQDWHRGDFSLILLGKNEADDIDEIHKFICSASAIWSEGDRLKPLSIDDYIRKLQEEQQATQLSPQHTDLLNTITLIWKQEDISIKETLESWVDRQIEHAQNLIRR